MRKIKLLLAAMLCIVGTGMMKAGVITSASQLSNTKVYTIKTTRGYMTLNTAQTMIVSSHSSDGGTVNVAAATDDASKQFGILNIDGKYFIYSPKLNKFACFQNWNLVFYTDRGVALDITNDGNGNPDGSKLRFFAHGMGSTGYNKFCLNNNNSGSLVLNNYNGAEAGNTVSIEEVAGVTLDVDAAMAVWNGTPDFFDPHKVYTISNERISKWTANEAGTGLTGTSTYTGASDAYQQFAFFKYDGKPYLYNLGTKKFVATDGTLTSNKGDAATISVWRTGDTTYPYCFFIEEKGLLFNAQGGGGFSINGWNSSHDEGNKHGLVEVAGVDAYDEILALFEIPSWDVTYNIYFNGEKIGEEVRNQDKDSQAGLSSLWNNDFVTFTYEPTTITTGVTSVDATVNWTGPTLYSDYESIEWKNLYVDRSEDGNYYLATGDANKHYFKDPTDKQRASDAYQWGFVGNPYQLKVYNKLAGPTQTLHSDATIGMADGDSYWSIKINYSNGFMIGKTGNTNSFINQAGGYTGTKMGYWSSTQDVGSVFHLADVPEVPVTNVYFDITFNGAVAHTVAVAGLEIGEDVPAMPTETWPAYTTVTAPDVTGLTVTQDMHIEVPATWAGPFELSADVATARWYDMAIRETWYVTSDNKDGDGALKTVNANALGLGEDAYHWAFVGDPWHIQVYNKAEANNFGYPTQANQGIPSFEADTYYWTIKASTSGIDNSFVMNVGGTDLYINQYGGKGGSLKFWESGNNISDGGSAFTVFDIPTDYATYVAAEISPSMESEAKYFVLKPAVAETVGYDAAYKTSCTFEQYKAMKLAFMEINMDDMDNFVLPETGYYRFKSKYYNTYMGLESTAVLDNFSGNSAFTVVKLTKGTDENEGKYTISLQGRYFKGLSRSVDAPLTENANEAAWFTPAIVEIGYGCFGDANPKVAEGYSYVHAASNAGDNKVVGWQANAEASKWIIEDAESFDLTIGETGYATTYLPFPVIVPNDVTAYVAQITQNTNGSQYLALSDLPGTIPAQTAVVLKANAETYQFEIGEKAVPEGEYLDVSEDEVNGQEALTKELDDLTKNNVLKGTLAPIEAAGKYVLAQVDPDTEGSGYPVAFCLADRGTIAAGKAYLDLDDAEVKAFYFMFPEDDPTSINAVNGEGFMVNGPVYNLAGQRLNKMQKGINIVNGKKILR